MARTDKAAPTEFEFRILRVLWDQGPATARSVREELQKRQGGTIGYTTVLKMLQVMETKNMVRVDRSARSHVYAPSLEEGTTKTRAVSDFVARTFDGKPAELLVHLVREARLDAATIAELERSIEELRRNEMGGKK